MAITPEFLDELRQRFDTSQVVGRRVKLVRKGREFSGLCPFHKEKTPSFTVNDEKSFYHCFGCGAHGDIVRFTMETEGLSFPETVERLAAAAGMTMPVDTPEQRQAVEKSKGLKEVMEAACLWYQNQLFAESGAQAQDYVRSRALAGETVKEFRLGFAPNGSQLLRSHMQDLGFKDSHLLEAGLIRKPDDGREPYDYFRGRLMFPIMNRSGQVIAFGGRVMGEGEPKYLNSPETSLFNKGATLYGLDKARQAAYQAGEIIVTEGYMDVIALWQNGFSQSVAPLGTALTEDQIKLLWRIVEEPTLCFDGDAAGQRAALRAATRALPLLEPGKSLKTAFLPQGEDPDTLLRSEGVRRMREVLDDHKPLVDFLWEQELADLQSTTPEHLAGLNKKLKQHAFTITDEVIRQAYHKAFNDRYQARFFGRNQPQNYGRQNSNNARSFGRKGGRFSFRPNYEIAKGGLGLQSGMKFENRRQEALLAGFVNYPALLEIYGESLAEIDFRDNELKSLRDKLLDTVFSEENLDREGIKCHLSGLGLTRAVDRVTSTTVYDHAGFVEPGLHLEQAKEGLTHLLDLIHGDQLKKELLDARQRYAGDVTNEALKNEVTTKGRLLREWEDRLVDLDRFDEMTKGS